MRIAYGKLGRSIPLTLANASNVGGDIEVIQLMHKMLDAGHTVHIIGRNRGDEEDHLGAHPLLYNEWDKGGAFEDPVPVASRHHDAAFDLYESWLRERMKRLPQFDAWVIWLGQHGSSVHPVPAIQDGKIGTWTNPMGSDVNYGYPLIAMVNHLGVRPIWLCPDPRNMVKFRDLWDPNQRTILAQFKTQKDNNFYDERDGRLRPGQTRYVYSGIELLAVQPNGEQYEGREQLFGMLVNEGYSNLGSKGRLHLIKNWTKDLAPYSLYGTWCDKSAQELASIGIGEHVGSPVIPAAWPTPVQLDGVNNTLSRWRCTMTFPATASGWATSKPWECFRAGTVCFRHPEYDTQNHIYGNGMNPDLVKYLSPPVSTSLKSRIEDMKSYARWEDVAREQYKHYVERLGATTQGAAMVLHACAAVAEGKDYT